MERSTRGGGGGQKAEILNGRRNPAHQRNLDARHQDQEEGWNRYKSKHAKKLEAKNRKVWNKVFATTMFISNFPEAPRKTLLEHVLIHMGRFNQLAFHLRRIYMVTVLFLFDILMLLISKPFWKILRPIASSSMVPRLELIW